MFWKYGRMILFIFILNFIPNFCRVPPSLPRKSTHPLTNGSLSLARPTFEGSMMFLIIFPPTLSFSPSNQSNQPPLAVIRYVQHNVIYHFKVSPYKLKRINLSLCRCENIVWNFSYYNNSIRPNDILLNACCPHHTL